MNDYFEVRKKPKVVEAKGPFYEPEAIETLEGEYEADGEYLEYGYYIIRGVQGEQYPCRADIFEETYERVAE